jgi:hypothetical protein
MLLTLLSLALVGPADPASRCLGGPALVGLGRFPPAAVLLRGEARRFPRRRSRDYPDPNDDSDDEGGAGARKAEPPAGLLPLLHRQPTPLGTASEEPVLRPRPGHTPLIYALCTLLL